MTGAGSAGAIVTGWDLGGPDSDIAIWQSEQGGGVESVVAPLPGTLEAAGRLSATPGEIIGSLILWSAIGVGVFVAFYLGSEALHVAAETAQEFRR